MNINKVILVGRLGRDPEVKYTQAGKAVCSFTLATSYKLKSGEEETEWHRCQAWDKAAELIGEYGKKGTMLYIEGRLKTRSWEQEGQKKFSTEVVVSTFQFGPKPASQGSGRESGRESGQENFDDDIPF